MIIGNLVNVLIQHSLFCNQNLAVVVPELNPFPEFEEIESCAAPELVRSLPEGV